jgi:hypothetical protein
MYAFVHIEKTAGTTLNSILRRSFGTGHCDMRLPICKRPLDNVDARQHVSAADLRRVRWIYRHLRGIAGHNVKPYADLHEACPDIRFFTFLRDPVARTRSHFLNRGQGHQRPDLERWMAQPWMHNWQTRMLAGEPNLQRAIDLIGTRVKFVGLAERFDESLLMLGQWLALPGFSPEYQSRNTFGNQRTPRAAAQAGVDISYLKSPEVISIIQESNTTDQALYDWIQREVFPAQVAAFRGDLTANVAALRAANASSPEALEPLPSRLLRNFAYKTLLHCRVM